MKYAWREGGPKPKIPAEVFGTVVEQISGGDIEGVKPEAIVEAARAPSSPIHALFNWDNAEAAELYRRQQARHYVGALQIVRIRTEEGPTVSNRAFFAVKPRGYVPHDRVLSDRDLKHQVIASAKKELESYVQKYASILAFGTFVPRLQEIIDGMRDEIDQLAVDATTRRRPRAASQPVDDALATAPV